MTHAHCMLDDRGYKHTLVEYVIIIAFPLQQLLHECPQCYVIPTLPVLLVLQQAQTALENSTLYFDSACLCFTASCVFSNLSATSHYQRTLLTARNFCIFNE